MQHRTATRPSRQAEGRAEKYREIIAQNRRREDAKLAYAGGICLCAALTVEAFGIAPALIGAAICIPLAWLALEKGWY